MFFICAFLETNASSAHVDKKTKVEIIASATLKKDIIAEKAFVNLIAAINKGSVRDVIKILDETPSLINAKGDMDEEYGWTPLHHACKTGNISIIKALIEKGADVNARDRDDSTPIYNNKAINNIGVVKLLVANGANIKDPFLLTILIVENNFPVFSFLIEKGTNFKGYDMYGSTPIIYSGSSRNPEFLRLLISKGADVNAKNKEGDTSLHNAALSGNINSVRLLISKGAKVNVQNAEGSTPIYNAAWAGSLEAVKILSDNGADINIKSHNGNTPMVAAKLRKNYSTVTFLETLGKKE